VTIGTPRTAASRVLTGRRALLLFFYLWPAVLVAPSGPSMSDSVLLAAMRLVDHGTWRLTDDRDPALAFQTLAFDISVSDGAVYSGVGPGASVVAAPVYALMRPLIPLFGNDVVAGRRIPGYYLANSRALGVEPSEHFKGLYLLQMLMVLVVIAPLYAGFLVDLHDLALERGSRPSQALVVAVAAGIGSLTVYYSSMYSRQAVAYLLLWRAVLLFARDRPPTLGRCALAGALCGASVSVDYPAAILAALLVVFVVPGLGVRRSLALLVPLAVLVGLTGLYHFTVFGSAFSTPYHHRFWTTPSVLAERGVDLAAFQAGPRLGIGAPDPRVMLELCFGPYKGLFLCAPVLALGLLGHLLALGGARRRVGSAFCLLAFAAYLTFNGAIGAHMGELGRQYWGGLGTLWGPRYLFAILPFLAFGIAGLDWGRAVVRYSALGLLAVSCALNVAATMLSQTTMSTFVFDPELGSPITHLAGLLLRLGPRVPLLDAYGVSPALQVVVVLALLAASAALLWRARHCAAVDPT